MKKSISIPSVRIEIKPSKMLEGEVGVFATRNLAKNSIIADAEQFPEIFVPWSEFHKLDPITQRKIMDYCCGDEKGFLVPPDLNYLSIAWHLNHSCEPNVGFNDNSDFVAVRNIKKGEELCWDYSYLESNPNFKMKCACGKRVCRKLITGNDWIFLLNDVKKFKYISPEIKKKVKLNINK